jgi:hypothetical protein
MNVSAIASDLQSQMTVYNIPEGMKHLAGKIMDIDSHEMLHRRYAVLLLGLSPCRGRQELHQIALRKN